MVNDGSELDLTAFAYGRGIKFVESSGLPLRTVIEPLGFFVSAVLVVQPVFFRSRSSEAFVFRAVTALRQKRKAKRMTTLVRRDILLLHLKLFTGVYVLLNHDSHERIIELFRYRRSEFEVETFAMERHVTVAVYVGTRYVEAVADETVQSLTPLRLNVFDDRCYLLVH